MFPKMLMCFSYVEVFVLIVRSEARYTFKTGLTLTRWFTFAFGINCRELSMLRCAKQTHYRQVNRGTKPTTCVTALVIRSKRLSTPRHRKYYRRGDPLVAQSPWCRH